MMAAAATSPEGRARTPEETSALNTVLHHLGTWFGAYDFGPGITLPLISPIDDQRYFAERAERIFDTLATEARPAECSLLDIGCSDGYFTVAAARRGYRDVTGIDMRPDSIARAKFAASWFGVEQIDFRVGSVYELDRIFTRKFDVVLCQGLFYHLSDPVSGMIQTLRRTGRVALVAGWTLQDPLVNGLAVFGMRRENPADPRDGDTPVALWPTDPALRMLLDYVGFVRVRDVMDVATAPASTRYRDGWRELLAFPP
jgi:SAM-dependent methyltransferase